MKVKTGASLGGGRTISVELYDLDIKEEVEGWNQLTSVAQFRKLAAKADMMVVDYLYRANAISKERASERLTVLKQAFEK